MRINQVGHGDSAVGGIAISRGTRDETCDANGTFIYLHDLDDGAVWSAGFQPTCVVPDEYEFHGRKWHGGDFSAG